jgi:hypothetical protein
MQSTKALVDAARIQAEASSKQADAAEKSFNLLIAERHASHSYQETVFGRAVEELARKLTRYVSFVGAGVKSWERDPVCLIPAEWEICLEYVSRKHPESLAAYLHLEQGLRHLSCEVEAIRMTPENWGAIEPRRNKTLNQLQDLQGELMKLVSQREHANA